jgi:hypothetical protein
MILKTSVKLSQQADLNWGEFSERPTRFLREIYADPKLVFTYEGALLGIGFRYFSLATFNYVELIKTPETRYLSIGPLIEIMYRVYGSLYLKVDGWYEFISINDTPDKERTNLVMELNWNF